MCSSLVIVVDSPPGRNERVQPVQLLGRAHLDRVDAECVEHLTMLAERALQREHTYLHSEGLRSATVSLRAGHLGAG